MASVAAYVRLAETSELHFFFKEPWTDGVIRDFFIEAPRYEGETVGKRGVHKYRYTMIAHWPDRDTTKDIYDFDMPSLRKTDLVWMLTNFAHRTMWNVHVFVKKNTLGWFKRHVLDVDNSFLSWFCCGPCISCCCKIKFMGVRPAVLTEEHTTQIDRLADLFLRSKKNTGIE